MVDAARCAVEVFGHRSEMQAQPGQVLSGEVRAGLDAEASHLFRAARADPVKASHRQTGNE